MHPVSEPIDPVDLIHDLDPKQFGPYRVSMDQDVDMQLWDTLKLRLRRKKEVIWCMDVIEAQIELNEVTASQFHSVQEALLVVFRVRVNREEEIREVILPVWAASITGLTPLRP